MLYVQTLRDLSLVHAKRDLQGMEHIVEVIFVQLSIGSLFRFALFYGQKNLIFITMFGAVLRNEPIRVNIR